jgi:DNA invertase Pin-like site-specific DNA recombinase
MKTGCARFSTDNQNPDLQLSALKPAGCDMIFTGKATGANLNRQELEKCFKLSGRVTC